MDWLAQPHVLANKKFTPPNLTALLILAGVLYLRRNAEADHLLLHTKKTGQEDVHYREVIGR